MTSTVDVTQLLILSEAYVEGKVQADGLVVVVVEENPSTGYHWRYEVAVGTEGVVEPLNDVFIPGRRMPGAPGAHSFLFGPVRTGLAMVMFRLYPPGQSMPEREFACQIEIMKPEN